MSFDKDTNTITLDDDSDFLVDSGLFFINMLRQTSQAENAPSGLVKDWKTIEKWLECQNSEITSIEEEKIGKAWKAYLAIGLAPSFKVLRRFL